MEPEEYALMYRVEQRHWWYQGMADISRGLLSSVYPPGARLRILDAGCGTGGALTFLQAYGRPVGVDLMRVALDYAKERRRHAEHTSALAQASVAVLPFADADFDLVTSFDVLYHLGVADDETALREFWRVLRTGGRVLLRLPALEWLRGGHDVVVHTRQRYTREEVTAKLARCGFVAEKVSYANTWLLPLVAAKRRFANGHGRGEPAVHPYSDLSGGPPRFAILNGLLRAVLRSEAPFIRSVGLPLGSSIFALARKPE